jgi:hypothetical protein
MSKAAIARLHFGSAPAIVRIKNGFYASEYLDLLRGQRHHDSPIFLIIGDQIDSGVLA